MALIYYIPDSISSSQFQASWSRVPRKFVACTFTCHHVGYFTHLPSPSCMFVLSTQSFLRCPITFVTILFNCAAKRPQLKSS